MGGRPRQPTRQLQTDQTTCARTPVGVNHVVLKVRDLEESHRFWTEIMGFGQVGEFGRTQDRPNAPAMRFDSGLSNGQLSHHDLALQEVEEPSDPATTRVGINHLAITMPDREAFVAQLRFLQERGVPLDARINHGVSHSVYLRDPNDIGIELLYELPRDVWEGDTNAALNYVESLPKEGPEALIDRTDSPCFGAD